MNDNSWDGEFKIDFSHHCSSTCGCAQFQENDYPFVHPLFVIRPSSKEHVWWWFEIFHWQGIFIQECRKDLFISVSWMNVWMNELQGLNGKMKGELIEESKEDEYTLYVINLWKNTICLIHRLYSNGEKNTII